MGSLIRNLYSAVFFIFVGSWAGAQSGIDTLLLQYKKADPREKVYVHFDKNIYNPGETIWFKAYLSSGSARSEASTNFYAEILTDSGRLMDKKTAPILFSGAHSHFEIPASYRSHRLIFRAYTVAMLNGDTSFLYAKAITVANPVPRIPAGRPSEPRLALLPEGGDLTAGVNTRIAFKASMADGSPVDITGSLMGTDGKEITTFRSVHHGMGTFSFSPVAGALYTVQWKDEKGVTRTQELPGAVTEGISLQVTDKPDEISGTSIGKTFTIERPETAPDRLKQLTLMGIMDGEVMYEATINLSRKTKASATIPTDEMNSGIMQVTVFDANFMPVAERICFVNNRNFEFDADAWIAELNTAKRGLNVAEVKISDTMPVNLSLSITDADLDISLPMADNIVTATLLTGDLRGPIYKPYYYFYNTSDSVGLHLDLVMLTNGWRRYPWEKIFHTDTTLPRFTDNYFLSIEGKLAGASARYKSGLELAGFLKTANSEKSSLIILPVDRDGNVKQPGMFFYDTAKLYLGYNDKNRVFDPSSLILTNGLLQPDIRTGLSAAMAGIPYLPDSATLQKNFRNNKDFLKVAAKQFKDAHELANVTVTAKAKTTIQKMDEKYASGLFSGGNSTQFDVANDPMATASFSVFQYLQGRVAGLQITGAGPNASLNWRGGSPGIYLDEMESDASMVGNISMADVAYIKVFNPGSSFGFRNGGNGVIAIYTKRGDDRTATADSKMGMVKLNGYAAIKEFYAPDYSKPSPDEFYDNLGATLYWDPMIVLGDQQKRKTIRFYNNDITKRFRVVLEGISEDGRLVHIEKVVTKE